MEGSPRACDHRQAEGLTYDGDFCDEYSSNGICHPEGGKHPRLGMRECEAAGPHRRWPRLLRGFASETLPGRTGSVHKETGSMGPPPGPPAAASPPGPPALARPRGGAHARSVFSMMNLTFSSVSSVMRTVGWLAYGMAAPPRSRFQPRSRPRSRRPERPPGPSPPRSLRPRCARKNSPCQAEYDFIGAGEGPGAAPPLLAAAAASPALVQPRQVLDLWAQGERGLVPLSWAAAGAGAEGRPVCYEQRCGGERHHRGLGTGKNQTGATFSHPSDRNLLSRSKVSAWVYCCGHTDLGTEFMVLGHYTCSSILQRPAELSTPVKEYTSRHPGRGRFRICSPNSYLLG